MVGACSDQSRVERDLIWDIADGIATITINRPATMNAVDDELLDAIRCCLELALQSDVGAVVLAGQGRAFCSGASLDTVDLNEPPSDRTVVALGKLVEAIRAAPVPVIAQVQGAAVGLGFSLVLACDISVAAESAYLYMAFSAIGLMPDGGATTLLTQAVGHTRAMQICLLPDRIPAAEAYRMGLFSLVVPDADLSASVRTVAARLADGYRHAHALTKSAINNASASLGDAIETERVGQLALMGSEDFHAAVTAFRARRDKSAKSS